MNSFAAEYFGTEARRRDTQLNHVVSIYLFYTYSNFILRNLHLSAKQGFYRFERDAIFASGGWLPRVCRKLIL